MCIVCTVQFAPKLCFNYLPKKHTSILFYLGKIPIPSFSLNVGPFLGGRDEANNYIQNEYLLQGEKCVNVFIQPFPRPVRANGKNAASEWYKVTNSTCIHPPRNQRSDIIEDLKNLMNLHTSFEHANFPSLQNYHANVEQQDIKQHHTRCFLHLTFTIHRKENHAWYFTL